MSDERLLLDGYLKTLKLPTMRAEYKALARKCTQANAAYEDFLQYLFSGSIRVLGAEKAV